MVNAAKVTEVMDHIKAHPEQHDPEFWAAWQEDATTYCFAGHTLVFDGWKFIEFGGMLEGSISSSFTAIKDGVRTEDIIGTAAGILGLDRGQAFYLFYQASTVEDIEEAVDRFLA